ncbi:RNA-guided pseudouridylation complex pseudouridine synthase subunit Cbf5 [Candidatus Woesearchaeota archaeon]|nr:RNA-guided pseudouridylation complex pseudouridine synthase subunit Cbf5 [Candidatus Woesearchaeota archaeon]
MGHLPFEKLNREIIVKRDIQPSSLGVDPKKRPIAELLVNSVICVDKPKGPTSHQVAAYVQKIFEIDKSGHGGTLDPNVCGVLPTAIGKATRVVQALQPAGKEYVCVMHLHKEIPKDKILDAMKEFEGRIKQLPPIKSAVKRQYRYRKIYYIDILEIKDKDVLFFVGCQAGTYIRKLCHDIGVRLGCGAHMQDLRRTKAGPFREDELCTLQDLTDAYHFYKKEGNDKFLRKLLMPIEKAVEHLGKVYILDSSVDTICHGASLAVPGIAKVETEIQQDELVAIMTLKGELIALGNSKMASNDMVKAEKGIAATLEAVFMSPGTYPKMQKKD